MEQQIISADYFYFGKCPARGDFVRSNGQHAMIKVLDEWIANSLEQLQRSGAGYTHYDQMAGFSFAFCNPKVPLALVGYLHPSHDASNRRFPLITGYRIQLRQPERFVAQASLYLSSLWDIARSKNLEVRQNADAEQVMKTLESTIEPDLQPTKPSFLSDQTVNSFAAQLGLSQYNFVQSLLALGLLLQPIVSQGAKKLNKILCLPLGAPYTDAIVSFWLDLISDFIKRHNLDLSIVVWHQQPRPVLLIGFQGADIVELKDMMQSNTHSEHWVYVTDAAWVDDYLEHDAGLATLEQVLCDSYISLPEAVKLFKQIFLGQ